MPPEHTYDLYCNLRPNFLITTIKIYYDPNDNEVKSTVINKALTQHRSCPNVINDLMYFTPYEIENLIRSANILKR